MTDLSKRYPDHRARRRLIGGVAALLFLSLLGWFVYSAAVHSRPAVAARVQSFEVVSDTLAKAIVTIDRRDAATPVSCLVYGQAQSYERVGEITVTLPAGGDEITKLPVEMKTFKRATAVAVTDCKVV